MGTFLTTTALCAQIPELTYCETYVLLQMSFAADDNTGHNTLNGVQRYNKIGSHVYISIKNLAQTGSFDRGTLNKAVKSLLENGYIRLTTERNTGKQKRSTNTYEINVSKIIRILDYQETVNKLNLDRNNEKVKKFYRSAISTYEDDYDNPPFSSFKKVEKGMLIDHWENLVDTGEEALQHFWRTYRQKKVGADGSSTDKRKGLEEATTTSSIKNDNTYEIKDANQHLLEHLLEEQPETIDQKRWNMFKNNFPYRQPYKDKNGTFDQSVKFGIDQLNQNGILDPELADYWNDDEKQAFNAQRTGGLYQLEKYNENWNDCLIVLAERKFQTVSL